MAGSHRSAGDLETRTEPPQLGDPAVRYLRAAELKLPQALHPGQVHKTRVGDPRLSQVERGEVAEPGQLPQPGAGHLRAPQAEMPQARKRREWDPVLQHLREWIPQLASDRSAEAAVFRDRLKAIESLVAGAPTRVAEILDAGERIYPRPACAMLDNHDVTRVGDWLDGDASRSALALKLLASRRGPISILYGTETGLRAGVPPKPAIDESSRLWMNWETADDALLDVCRRSLEARRQAPALAEGETVARCVLGPVLG